MRRAAVLSLVPTHRFEKVWFRALDGNDDNTAAALRFKDWRDILSSGTTLIVTAKEPPTQWKDGTTFLPECVDVPIQTSMYVFIEMLQKELVTNEAKIIQINAGGVVHLKKMKYRQLNSPDAEFAPYRQAASK